MASENVGSSSSVVGVGATSYPAADPTQGSPAPASTPSPVFAILQKLEDSICRTAAVVSEGAGRYYDMLPFVEESLDKIRHVGGAQLTRRCERELHHLEALMYRLEGLVYADASNEPPPLTMNVMFEHEDLTRRIQAKEAKLKRLHRQHRAVLAEIDAYIDAAFFKDAGSLEGEANLRKLEREKMRLGRVVEVEARALQLLRQEEEDGEAAFARLQQRQEARTRDRQATGLVAVKAKIASFSLLKLM